MFNYHQPNLENMQQYMSQENEKGGNGPNWWSIPAGMSSIRILPPWDPTGRVALPVYTHPIEYKGKDMTYTKYNWTCVNKTASKPCAICEGLAGLAAAGVDVSKWEANRRQFYFNAIVMHDPNRENPTPAGTHVLLKAPKTFYDWVIAQITNPMIGDITNIENGIDVYVTKEGTGLGTSYNMTLSPNGRTAIPKEYLEKIDNLYNLDEVFSSGFDQQQIDELVAHLRNSAGAMAGGVQNTMNQMGGYTQAPPQYPPMQSQAPAYAPPITGGYTAPTPTAPANQFQQSAPNQFSAPPTPFSNPGAVPQAPAQPVPPQGSNPPWETASTGIPVSPTNSNLPKCFGNYDSGNVNCVVCPHEIDCSKNG